MTVPVLTLTPASPTALSMYPSQQGVLYPSSGIWPSLGTFPGPAALILTPAAP